jgi:hypothetical protein
MKVRTEAKMMLIHLGNTVACIQQLIGGISSTLNIYISSSGVLKVIGVENEYL